MEESRRFSEIEIGRPHFGDQGGDFALRWQKGGADFGREAENHPFVVVRLIEIIVRVAVGAVDDAHAGVAQHVTVFTGHVAAHFHENFMMGRIGKDVPPWNEQHAAVAVIVEGGHEFMVFDERAQGLRFRFGEGAGAAIGFAGGAAAGTDGVITPFVAEIAIEIDAPGGIRIEAAVFAPEPVAEFDANVSVGIDHRHQPDLPVVDEPGDPLIAAIAGGEKLEKIHDDFRRDDLAGVDGAGVEDARFVILFEVGVVGNFDRPDVAALDAAADAVEPGDVRPGLRRGGQLIADFLPGVIGAHVLIHAAGELVQGGLRMQNPGAETGAMQLRQLGGADDGVGVAVDA